MVQRLDTLLACCRLYNTSADVSDGVRQRLVEQVVMICGINADDLANMIRASALSFLPADDAARAALQTRDRALDGELVEHLRTLRYGLDDLGATLEAKRQVRAQFDALDPAVRR